MSVQLRHESSTIPTHVLLCGWPPFSVLISQYTSPIQCILSIWMSSGAYCRGSIEMLHVTSYIITWAKNPVGGSPVSAQTIPTHWRREANKTGSGSPVISRTNLWSVRGGFGKLYWSMDTESEPHWSQLEPYFRSKQWLLSSLKGKVLSNKWHGTALENMHQKINEIPFDGKQQFY